MEPRDVSILALDISSLPEVEYWVTLLNPYFSIFKIGLELIMSVGPPAAVELVHSMGGSTFLDGKFDDIPETVGKATAAANRLGVKMLTVHASAGIPVMQAAVANKGNVKILATTVLTSIRDAYKDRDDLRHSAHHIFGQEVNSKVFEFTEDAIDADCDGITCSPRELRIVSGLSQMKPLIKVTPGIRGNSDPKDDQKRTMTAQQAIKAGADYLVVGRPILKHNNPLEAAKRFTDEVALGLEKRKRGIR